MSLALAYNLDLPYPGEGYFWDAAGSIFGVTALGLVKRGGFCSKLVASAKVSYKDEQGQTLRGTDAVLRTAERLLAEVAQKA